MTRSEGIDSVRVWTREFPEDRPLPGVEVVRIATPNDGNHAGAIATIELPSEMAQRLRKAIMSVLLNPQSDCYSLAAHLLGHPDTPPSSRYYDHPRLILWKPEQITTEQALMLPPGTALAFAPEDIVGSDTRWNHIATTCGGGRLLQVFGINNPVALASIDETMSYLESQSVATLSALPDTPYDPSTFPTPSPHSHSVLSLGILPA
jgi:hypothetical protein